ncbi:MAG: glycosyltransferase family 4 protein [Acidobacteriota bacterium]
MIVCAPHLGLREGSDLGGEVSERALLTRLAAMGDTIRLLMPPEADAGPLAPNWQLERWRRRRARRWWRSNAAAAQALCASHRRQPFDLLHVHSPLHFGRGALAARRRLRARFPVVMHHHHLKGNALERSLERAACAASDCVIVPSRFSAAALAAAGGTPAGGASVIPRGVDPPPRSTARGTPACGDDHRHQEAAGRRVLLSVGRLVRRKNPLLLVDAFARVERALPGRAMLRFIGDGPLAGCVRRRARALGVERWVELRGRLPAQHKWRELSACAVFLTASDLEGFGLAVAEAMTAGSAVVAPRACAFPEIIDDGVDGMLVPPLDAEATAQAVMALLGDPSRARALGDSACRRAVSQFSWDASARRLRDLYLDLSEGCRRHA